MTLALGALTLAAANAYAQKKSLPARMVDIVSSQISIARDRAEMQLELPDGRHLNFATVVGAPHSLQVSGDNYTIGVNRGDPVDRGWRDLLNRAMDAESSDLPPMLAGWRSADYGLPFQRALDDVLMSGGGPLPPAPPVAPGMNDSVQRLNEKVAELQDQLQNARHDVVATERRHRGPDWLSPLRSVVHGIADIFSTVITYTVLFFLGFAIVMFGGRKYIEGVADVARHHTGRSFMVGLAGSFLLIPVFVLGIIALAISIVGIPALLVWIPLFPVAAICAGVLGFVSVAHGAGESWAERRYYGSEWFTRANSYYFMATGLALLCSLFIAGGVVEMAGSWLGPIRKLLEFFGFIVTWAACTVGFGAVLITRGGSRPEGRAPATTFDESHA